MEGVMAIFQPVRIVKRGNSYQLYYHNPRGERKRISVGEDYSQVQRLSMKFTDWLLEGKDPEQEILKSHNMEHAPTLSEFYDFFMERHGNQQSKSMIQLYNERFQNIRRCPGLCNVPINNISKKLVYDYMHLRLKQDKVSNSTVNREAAVIKTMLNKAVEWEIIETNPVHGLKQLAEPPKRNVDLSFENAQALISELPESFANIVEFAIYTGFRKENILSLTIEQCSIPENGDASVKLKIKGGEYKTCPLGPNAVDVLRRAIGLRKKGYVFINPQTNNRYMTVSDSFVRAVKKLHLKVGNSYLRFHDLRHVFATWLHGQGVSLDILRILMNHKKRSTTDRYTTARTNGASHVLSLMPKIVHVPSDAFRAADTN